jgi:hypothetical protein
MAIPGTISRDHVAVPAGQAAAALSTCQPAGRRD